MKKSILAIVLAVATLVTFILPVSADDWNWRDDGKFEVSTWNASIVRDGSIKVDAELEAEYLGGTKIVDVGEPYKRGGYEDVWEIGSAKFEAYVAVDTSGMFIYVEVEDNTIFAADKVDTDGNSGDCVQIYLDWCTPDIAHPFPEVMYADYIATGTKWDYATYRTMYGVSGLQYLGWLSADYHGVLSAAWGFSPASALGPKGTDAVGYQAKIVEGGWACEFFVPWRDAEQKAMIAEGHQFHCGLGFQVNDDADLDDTITPGKHENNTITFDMRKEVGLSYYADYSKLPNIMWADDYPEGYWEGTYVPPVVEEGVDTGDTVVAIVAALAVAGAGVVLFSRKKED